LLTSVKPTLQAHLSWHRMSSYSRHSESLVTRCCSNR